mmetsp:Transcript_32209/g.92690  ORF Transcript_32209/g.92690 Transcript_32209/m.92690 type:complete len:80 (-) Transcript_32209:353-592(-)
MRFLSMPFARMRLAPSPLGTFLRWTCCKDRVHDVPPCHPELHKLMPLLQQRPMRDWSVVASAARLHISDPTQGELTPSP